MNDKDLSDLPLKTYLINLDRAADRLSAMQDKLNSMGLPFERVAAVDGQTLELPISDFREGTYRLLHGRRGNPAEVGCYLSHIECAKRLLASESEFALILEDDLEFPPDLKQLLRAAIEANADWDILRLSTVNRGRKYPFAGLTSQRSFAVALTREKGSGAYLLNRRAAAWFVEKLVPMRLPFDLAFDLEYLAGLKAAFVFPVPINQDTGLPSQIQAKRRTYHLRRWRYVTVQPYRAWLEASRFICRLRQLTWLLLKYAFLRRMDNLSSGTRAKSLSLTDGSRGD
jgi:glycosyl transferase family 25